MDIADPLYRYEPTTQSCAAEQSASFSLVVRWSDGPDGAS